MMENKLTIRINKPIADADYKNTLVSVINLAKNARFLFNSSELKEKQQIVKYLVQNYQVDGITPYFTIADPYNWLLNLAEEPTLLPDLESNQN